MNRIRVMSSIGGFHVQLGDLVLWVTSEGHWEDIAEAVAEGFKAVGAPREVPARKANVAGACYCGEDE